VNPSNVFIMSLRNIFQYHKTCYLDFFHFIGMYLLYRRDSLQQFKISLQCTLIRFSQHLPMLTPSTPHLKQLQEVSSILYMNMKSINHIPSPQLLHLTSHLPHVPHYMLYLFYSHVFCYRSPNLSIFKSISAHI
jgi:hypothetical protein